MDYAIMILAIIPSILSVIVSGIYAYIALKKAKEPPKDEAWETATKIICSRSGLVYSDDFIELYTELKTFKEKQNNNEELNQGKNPETGKS